MEAVQDSADPTGKRVRQQGGVWGGFWEYVVDVPESLTPPVHRCLCSVITSAPQLDS